MAKTLTRKQKVFVETFVETGVGAEAARQAYDIDPENKKLASVMAAENLAKPSIQQAVAHRVHSREEMVEEAHDSLLSAVRLDYFVFPKFMSDEDIKAHVEANGLTCINIRPSDKGKLAFFSLPDGASRSKGIELYHKLKGSFAAEKHLHVNVEVEASPAIKEAAKKLNDVFRAGNSGGDGVVPGDVGAQARDKE